MFAVIHMESRSAPHRTGRALRQVLCGSRTWGASARAHSMRLRLQQKKKNATQTACASNQFNPSAAIAVALKAHSRTHTHTRMIYGTCLVGAIFPDGDLWAAAVADDQGARIGYGGLRWWSYLTTPRLKCLCGNDYALHLT